MIGNVIRKRRKELKITLDELKLETGIDICTLSRYERNKQRINLESLGRISKALHVDPVYFFANGTDRKIRKQ